MKKLLFILCIIGLFSCKETQEEKAQSLVENYLKENLKDPSSYESVSFGVIDSTFTNVEDEPEFKRLDIAKGLLDKVDEAQLKVKMSYTYSLNERMKFQDEADMYLDSAKIIKAEVDSFVENYKPSFNGYLIKHKYRAKNGFGALDLTEQIFLIDKDQSKIIGVIDTTK